MTYPLKKRWVVYNPDLLVPLAGSSALVTKHINVLESTGRYYTYFCSKYSSRSKTVAYHLKRVHTYDENKSCSYLILLNLCKFWQNVFLSIVIHLIKNNFTVNGIILCLSTKVVDFSMELFLENVINTMPSFFNFLLYKLPNRLFFKDYFIYTVCF